MAGERRCRDPCRSGSKTIFLLVFKDKSHITKKRGGLNFVLFASFFIAEIHKIIYNITRYNKKKGKINHNEL